MSSVPLPLALPEPAKPARAPRVARAHAGQRTMQRRGKRFVTSVELKPWDEVALDELRRVSGLEDVGPALKYAMYQVLTARGVDLEALGVDLDTVRGALGVDLDAFRSEAPV